MTAVRLRNRWLAGIIVTGIGAAHAGTFYWDANGAAAGFGAAGGEWGVSAYWSSDSGGTTAPSNATMTAADEIGFGTSASGLSAGTITGPATAEGFLTLTFGAASGALTLSGGALNLASPSTIAVSNAADTVSTLLQGSGAGLVKQGGGALTLAGTNTHSGGTTVSNGTLVLGNDAALGASSGPLSLASSSAVLSLAGYSPAVGALTAVPGSRILGSSTSSTITATSASLAGHLLYSGVNTSSLKVDTSAANGPIELNGVISGVPGMLWSFNNIEFNAGGGDITLSGTNTLSWWSPGASLKFVGRVAGSGRFTHGGSVNGTAPLIFDTPVASTYAGIINSVWLGVVKQGAGTLVLTGANSYNGGTAVTNGMLQLGDGTANVSPGSGACPIAAGATLRLNYTNAVAPTWANVSGAGTLSLRTATRNDTGWGVGAALSTNFTGTLRIESGRLYMRNTMPVGNAAVIEVLDGGQLGMDTDTNPLPQNLVLAGTGYGDTGGHDGALRVGVSRTMSGSVVLADSATLVADGGNTGTLTGVISGGTNALLRFGGPAEGGTFVLSNTNTYGGGTSLAYGKLILNNNHALGTGPLTLAAGTALDSTVPGIALADHDETWNGSFTFTGSQSLNLGAGAVTLGNHTQVTVTTNALTVGGGITSSYNLAKAGSGTLNLNGALSTTGFLIVSAGTVNLNGTAIVAAPNQGIALSGASVFNVQSGGVLTYACPGSDFLVIGQGSAATLHVFGGGAVNVSGGGFAVGNTGSGVGVLTLDAGSAMTLDDAVPVAGGFIIGRSGGNGTVNLDGGTLTTGRDITAGGTSTFNFNGGTLKPGKSSATFLAGLSRANVRNGGAIFDTAGYDVAVGQSLQHSNVGGDSATDGGLIKNGAGALKLSGANAFNGGTSLNSGTLVLGSTTAIGTGTLTINGGALDSSVPGLVNAGNNAQSWNADFAFEGTQSLNLGTGVVTMAAGRQIDVKAGLLTVGGTIAGGGLALTKLGAGTLALNGTFGGSVTVSNGVLAGVGQLGATTLAAGAAVEGGYAGAGSLTLASLSFSGPGGIRGMLGAVAPVVVTGSVTTNGAISAFPLNLPTNGVYHLLSYGSGPDPFAAFRLAEPTRCLTLADDGAGRFIDIAVNTNDYPVWTGALSGEWSTNTLAAPANWVVKDTAVRTDFFTLDNVLFSDRATGITDVVVSRGDVRPNSTTFSNSAANYTLSGANGVLSGPLRKGGIGTLTIGNANAFSAVTIGAGALVLSNANAIGSASGTITIGGGALRAELPVVLSNRVVITGDCELSGGGGSLTLSGAMELGSGARTLTVSNSVIVGGAVSGSASLTKQGPGELAFNVVGSYAGGTTVNSGLLRVSGPNNGWSCLGTGAVTVNTNGAIDATGYNPFGWQTMGVGPVTINGGLISLVADCTFSRICTMTGGSIMGIGGLYVGGTYSGAPASLGFVINAAASPSTVANPIVLQGHGTFNVAADATASFTGGVRQQSVAYGLIKTGSGLMILEGASTYSGATSVSGGILRVNGSLGGSGAVGVGGGATLAGSGSVAGPVSIAAGGHLAPGANAPGTLTLTNGLLLTSGAVLNFDLGRSASDLLRISGGTFTGTDVGGVTVAISDAGAMRETTHTLVDWTGATAASVDLADFAVSLPAGYTDKAVLEIKGSKLVLTLYRGGFLMVR